MDDILIDVVKKTLSDHPSLIGTPATDQQISDAESALNLKFNSQYTQFIKIFGGSWAGISIHAFNNAPLLGKETVTGMTLNFRRYNPFYHDDESLLKNCYVLSSDGGEGYYLMSASGEIYIYYQDSGEIELLYESLAQLIRNELLIK
ncbi:SMI1/KNR4 family protein [Klebsiella aerogenes]